MKKLVFLISFIIVLFALFLFFSFRVSDYEITYEVGEYTIVERFSREGYYFFEIIGKERSFNFITESSYQRRRRLVTDIVEFTENDIFCIIPEIRNLVAYPLCYLDEERVSFSLINNPGLQALYPVNIEKTNEYFGSVEIRTFLDNAFLVRHYRGFYYISRNGLKEINLFNRDVYEMPLIGMVNNLVFVPDYNNDHSFNSAFVIDMRTGNYERWNLDSQIYFTAYFMGAIHNSIYLFDARTDNQHELVPHRRRMRIVNEGRRNPIIYRNGWEDIDIDVLRLREHRFVFPSFYHYELRGGQLFFEPMGIRVTDYRDAVIVHQNEDTIYYLYEDRLYAFNPFWGEVLLLRYFEWNFNKINMIFIYSV